MNLIRALLPEGHLFPRDIWSALATTTPQDRCRLIHREVAYCAQGVIPPRRGANRKQVVCPDPTVFYGTYTDTHGVTRDKTTLPNCSTCTHNKKKVMYLIPIEHHIQVTPLQLHVHFMHTPMQMYRCCTESLSPPPPPSPSYPAALMLHVEPMESHRSPR